METATDHFSQSLSAPPFLPPFPVLCQTLNQNFKQRSETKMVSFFFREWEPLKSTEMVSDDYM